MRKECGCHVAMIHSTGKSSIEFCPLHANAAALLAAAKDAHAALCDNGGREWPRAIRLAEQIAACEGVTE